MLRYDGEDGDPCDTGSTGSTGATGSTGSTGDNGAYGHGYGYGYGYGRSPLLTVVGTIDRRGVDPDAAGAGGAAGTRGVVGAGGAGGVAGAGSAAGTRGAGGATGGAGAVGVSGVAGVDRAAVAAGAAGAVGAAGAAGDSGAAGAAGALRSWVVGWTHRFEPPSARRSGEPNPAAVRRLVEAVVDVLLERRPAEQVKRWVSREVFGLLSTVAQRRAATRFAARSMVRSIRLHAPGPDAVESTVLVQDGPRVRAVALRFERTAAPLNGGQLNAFNTGLFAAQAAETSEVAQSDPVDRFEWRCTALQFA